MLTLIGFLLTILILVLVHEWGHYFVARLCGVKIIAFSIGFGQILFRRTDRLGCEWRFSAIPFGGYVKMLDSREDGNGNLTREELSRSFDHQSVGKRFMIVAAGPLMNLIVAVCLYMGTAFIGIDVPSNRIDVMDHSTVAMAKIESGSTITEVCGKKVENLVQIGRALTQNQDRYIALTFMSATGDVRTLDFTREELTDPQSGMISLPKVGITSYVDGLMIGQTIPDGAAVEAGLMPGDKVLAVNGKRIRSSVEFVDLIRGSNGQPLQLSVLKRTNEPATITVTPKLSVSDSGEKAYRIGAMIVSLPQTVKESFGVFDSVKIGFSQAYRFIAVTLNSFKRMILGQESIQTISGPIAIGQLAGQTLSNGLVSFLNFLAIVSISLGVINLFPIPVLDGGHLVIFVFEMLFRRQPGPKLMKFLQYIGLFFILGLTSVAISNDIASLFGLH